VSESSVAKENAQRGPGSAPGNVAALRCPTLRQAPAAVREAGSRWGMLIVAGLTSLIWRQCPRTRRGEC
jgi:hypothetical protein